MAPMERALRKSATTKMVIIGSLGVVFGLALVVAGGLASVRLLVLGLVFFVGGIAQIARGVKHLGGE